MADSVVGALVRRKFFQSMGLLTALISALLVGSAIATGGLRTFTLVITVGFLVLWTLFSREMWWLPMPIAVAFGGMVYFGFRVYVHEIALLLCIMALLPMLAVGKGAPVKPRAPLPLAVYLLTVYLFLHMVASVYVNRLDRAEGAGNIVRVYVNAIWPLLFLIVFHYQGSTRYLRIALIGMFVASLLRVIMGLVTYYYPVMLYVPFINLVFAPYYGAYDLRSSALQLALLSVCFACMQKRFVATIIHCLVFGTCTWLVMLGGGRLSLIMLFAIPVLAALVYRRFLALLVLGGLAVGIFIGLNHNPQILRGLPEVAQRTLSVLILKSPTQDIHEQVMLSDEWHQRLGELGRQRWLGSWRTFVVGHRIHPFDEAFNELGPDYTSHMELMADIASKMGAYESLLWTVLAVTGVLGAILYIIVFYDLVKPVVRPLLRERIRDPAHAFYFLAVYNVVVKTAFCWIAGGFPSQELLMAAIARVACEDERLKEATPAVAVAPVAAATPDARVMPPVIGRI